MTYCKYVLQFQICKAPFMGRNLDWNKTKMVMDTYMYYYIVISTYYYIVINNHLCFFPI